MATIEFTKETVWQFVSSSIEPDDGGDIDVKIGADPVTKRKALLFIDSGSGGAAAHSTILLISPSLAEDDKIQAMKAAMKKNVAIAFSLTDVSFHSTVLIIGAGFSDAALSEIQNSDTKVKKVTLDTLSNLL